MISRRAVIPSLAVLLFGTCPLHAEELYAIDPHVGGIEFSVGHMGLFTSRGWFRHFDAMLTIDQEHPERTRIVAEVDAGSIDMTWQDGAETLRSAPFFDVEHHPTIRFRSTSVSAVSPERYEVQGLLELRGVTKPLTLTATLVGQQADRRIADFVVKGMLRRSAYGMAADQMLISDNVDITIRARIRLAEAAPAG